MEGSVAPSAISSAVGVFPIGKSEVSARLPGLLELISNAVLRQIGKTPHAKVPINREELRTTQVAQTYPSVLLSAKSAHSGSRTRELQTIPGSVLHGADARAPPGCAGHRMGTKLCSLRITSGADGDGRAVAATCCLVPGAAGSCEPGCVPCIIHASTSRISMRLRQSKWSNSFCPFVFGKSWLD